MAVQVDKHLLGKMLSDGDRGVEWDALSPEEWSQIVRLSQAEGVATVLYWRLNQSNRLQLLPDPLRDTLRATYYSLQMNNAELIKELKVLTSLFAIAGIPVVALKGICYVLTIYPDPALRPMVDLDLLVPKSKLHEALRLVIQSGYVEPVPEAFPGLDEQLGHSVFLQKKSMPFVTFELHYSLVAEKSFRYAVPVDWFWTQTESITGSSSEPDLENMLMLTPTAQVLYASAHAMLQHGTRNTSLRWFYDLDRLIRVHAERMDWDLLLSQAHKFEWGSAVNASLSQAITFFDPPVPGQVLEDLARISDKNSELIVAYQGQPATHTMEEYLKLKTLNWRGRIKMVQALIVPSPAYMRWRYQLTNSWKLPFYYMCRWWGILNDAVRTLIIMTQKKHKKNIEIRLNHSPGKSR